MPYYSCPKTTASTAHKQARQRRTLCQFMKHCAAGLTLLAATGTSFGANLYWLSDAAASDDFMAAANWSGAFTTASDSLRVGGPVTTYPYSANLCKLTVAFGVADGTGDLNDALVVGGYRFEGHFELACGSGTTAYFRSIIVGDSKTASTDVDSTMVLTSGTIANAPVAVDTGYLTVGRNSTAGNTAFGIGYLYVNGGVVNMDRITIGEQKSGTTPDTLPPGEGHIVLQNDGVINLPCQKTFDPVAYVGLRLNNGDFTWKDNGNSTVTTGYLSVNTGTLVFQSADNSFGTDGKGILVNSGMPAGPGSALFTTHALVDVTGLADTANWVTLVTAAEGITLEDSTLLTPASIAEGWTYRLLDLDGDAGNATALQVTMMPPPTLACSVANGVLSVSWPAAYLGWTLQVQTNALNTGLTATWAGTDIPGTDLVTSTDIPISQDNPAVFFRLRK